MIYGLLSLTLLNGFSSFIIMQKRQGLSFLTMKVCQEEISRTNYDDWTIFQYCISISHDLSLISVYFVRDGAIKSPSENLPQTKRPPRTARKVPEGQAIVPDPGLVGLCWSLSGVSTVELGRDPSSLPGVVADYNDLADLKISRLGLEQYLRTRFKSVISSDQLIR